MMDVVNVNSLIRDAERSLMQARGAMGNGERHSALEHLRRATRTIAHTMQHVAGEVAEPGELVDRPACRTCDAPSKEPAV